MDRMGVAGSGKQMGKEKSEMQNKWPFHLIERSIEIAEPVK
jgi:hypothetical protein